MTKEYKQRCLRFILLVIAGLVVMTILALFGLAVVCYFLYADPLSEGERAVLQAVFAGPILFGLLIILAEELGSRARRQRAAEQSRLQIQV